MPTPVAGIIGQTLQIGTGDGVISPGPIPVAGSLYIGPQTPAFLVNMAHTYVLNVWGAKDNLPGWDADKIGIAESNRRLRAEVER